MMQKIKDLLLRLVSNYVRQERQKYINLGKNHAKFPFCACKIDENSDKLIKPCGLHKEWAGNLISKAVTIVMESLIERENKKGPGNDRKP